MELSACFFGKAKVSEFVKWKNFEVYFLVKAADPLLQVKPGSKKNPGPGVNF
jgi:hypothetical protein